jgi:hypothetical protein
VILGARTPEQRAFLIAYLSDKLGTTPGALIGHVPFEVVATVRAGYPTGAVLYINYRRTTVEMVCAGERGWLTRANIQSLFAYPFLQLGCWTVVSNVKRGNAAARTLNRKLGFVEVGVIPQGPGRNDDAILYVMTRDRCLWLPAPAQNEVRHAA